MREIVTSCSHTLEMHTYLLASTRVNWSRRFLLCRCFLTFRTFKQKLTLAALLPLAHAALMILLLGVGHMAKPALDLRHA